MKPMTFFAMLLAVALAQPLTAQHKGNAPPPPPDEEQVGTHSMLSACPADFRDGPYYENGRPYYGLAARSIVEGFLASAEPGDPWETVNVSSLRVLDNGTDYTVCQRLTSILTSGARNAPPPEPWVYFTAGGFIFVSSWIHAQPLSNYTITYGRVIVFDSAFNLLGSFAA
jgi:hypothetical protein